MAADRTSAMKSQMAGFLPLMDDVSTTCLPPASSLRRFNTQGLAPQGVSVRGFQTTIHDDAVEGGHGARAPFPRCGLDYTVPAIIRRSPRVTHQRDETIDAVYELAVGHGDEQREHHAEMQRQQRAHRGGVAQHEQQKAGEARHEQHDDEGDIHPHPVLIDQDRDRASIFPPVPQGPIKRPMPPSVPSTTGRSHHGYGASRAQK